MSPPLVRIPGREYPGYNGHALKGTTKIGKRISEFDEYQEWIEETMTTEDQPYIQVVSVNV